jgi:hypothetical protein
LYRWFEQFLSIQKPTQAIRRKAMRRFLGIMALAALATLTLLAANTSVGTWKYNATKSKFAPGPPYKSRTVKVEAHGEGIKVTVDGVSGDGSKHAYSYTANYDGKDNPVTGNPMADTIAYKRIDDNTVEATTKKGGKPSATVRIVVAKDEKSMTVTVKGKNAKGEAVSDVVAYDRQ